MIAAEASRQKGFTLLEMIVVLMITALVGALIMQGFLYFAGLQQASERQGQRLQQQTHLRGWLQDSVRTMVNGVDGIWTDLPPFQGGADGMSGTAYVGLTYAGGVARPTAVQWQLISEGGGVTLRYRERPEGSEQSSIWYRVRHWPESTAWFEYKTDTKWSREFSAESAVGQKSATVLPYGIKLTVDTPREQQVTTIAVPVTPMSYRAPEVEP